MKASIIINNKLLLASAITAFFSLTYILIRVNTNFPDALNIDKSGFELKDYIMGAGHLIVLVFNIYAILIIYSHFRHSKDFGILKTALLILGIFSLFSTGIEKVMVDEIARQYRSGMEVSEISILNISYVLNMLFSVFTLFYILKVLPIVYTVNGSEDSVDERIFTIAQFMGILSGLAGLLLVFDLAGKKTANDELVFYTPFFILFLIPYILAVLYWLSFKIRRKISDWYDEKQLQDIMKASLTTLVLSIPGLFLFLFLGIPSISHFFLYYVFLALVIFSGSTLFYYKS
jgi:O-antigen/teichoic acid export membrane protein